MHFGNSTARTWGPGTPGTQDTGKSVWKTPSYWYRYSLNQLQQVSADVGRVWGISYIYTVYSSTCSLDLSCYWFIETHILHTLVAYNRTSSPQQIGVSNNVVPSYLRNMRTYDITLLISNRTTAKYSKMYVCMAQTRRPTAQTNKHALYIHVLCV